MRKVIQEINKEITRLNTELEEAREKLDRSDANDVHHAMNFIQVVSRLHASIEALERFKKRLEG